MPFFSCVLAVTTAGGRVRSFLCGENLNSAQGRGWYHVVGTRCMVRHPRGSYVVNPLLSLGMTTSEINQFIVAVIHRQENPPQKRFLVYRMQLPTPILYLASLSEQARHCQGYDGLPACQGHPVRDGLRRGRAGEAGAQVSRGASAFEGPPI